MSDLLDVKNNIEQQLTFDPDVLHHPSALLLIKRI